MLATVARRGPQNWPQMHFIFRNSSLFLNRVFDKFPRFPLKRKLRRAFWPQGPPKAVPRGARGLPRHSLFHLGAQIVMLFGVFKKHTKNARTFLLFCFIYHVFLMFSDSQISMVFGRAFLPQGVPNASQGAPKASQGAPRSSQGAPRVPKEHPRAPKTAPVMPW